MKPSTAEPSQQPLPEERQLVRQAKAGDPTAFGMLYEAYVERIYRFVYFRVADDQTAEDLTSQVFLKAWEKLDGYRLRGVPFLAWLYTIARNTVTDHYRTHKQEAPLEEATLSWDDTSDDSEGNLVLQATAHRLRWAIQQLTDDQQQVLILKFINGMSTREVARQLGKRPGAVRALQMRALQALESILKDEE